MIEISKDMVNAAYHVGKQRGMTGLPEDFRQVLKEALEKSEHFEESAAIHNASHQARVDQFSVMGSDWAEPNFGKPLPPPSVSNLRGTE